jgi:hypothetical protein
MLERIFDKRRSTEGFDTKHCRSPIPSIRVTDHNLTDQEVYILLSLIDSPELTSFFRPDGKLGTLRLHGSFSRRSLPQPFEVKHGREISIGFQ